MVSVVVPCYNCEKTLDRCINSIRRQTQMELEIVLVDDGSFDRTGELCDEAARLDPRIKVVHQENKGLMNAWKRGVLEAAGEYIAFCDSDDYIDNNMVKTLEDTVLSYHVDIVLCGMVIEYFDKTVQYVENMLSEGHYQRKDIEKKILPVYFSSGEMQSGIILLSRCTKLFRKSLLMGNFDYLPDTISIGEDDLTTFASILAAKSIYCIGQFYPYHYIRNNDSMIGKYDRSMFQKLLDLRVQMCNVAHLYSYIYMDQMDAHFVSNVMLFAKKDICRSNEGYREVRKQLKAIREHSIFDEVIKHSSIKQYELKSKVFASLLIRKQYLIVYIITKTVSALGIGRP